MSDQSSLWCKSASLLVSDLGSHSSRVKVNDVPTVSDDNICFERGAAGNYSFSKNYIKCFMAEKYLSWILHSSKATDHISQLSTL